MIQIALTTPLTSWSLNRSVMIRKKIIRYAMNRKLQTTIQMMLQKFSMTESFSCRSRPGEMSPFVPLSSQQGSAPVIRDGRVVVCTSRRGDDPPPCVETEDHVLFTSRTI